MGLSHVSIVNEKYLELTFFIVTLVALAIKFPNAYLNLTLLVTGLLGVLLLFTYLKTTELLFSSNHQTLWLNPLGLFALVSKKKHKYVCLLIISIAMFISLLISIHNGHQNFSYLTICCTVLSINAAIIPKIYFNTFFS